MFLSIFALIAVYCGPITANHLQWIAVSFHFCNFASLLWPKNCKPVQKNPRYSSSDKKILGTKSSNRKIWICLLYRLILGVTFYLYCKLSCFDTFKFLNCPPYLLTYLFHRWKRLLYLLFGHSFQRPWLFLQYSHYRWNHIGREKIRLPTMYHYPWPKNKHQNPIWIATINQDISKVGYLPFDGNKKGLKCCSNFFWLAKNLLETKIFGLANFQTFFLRKYLIFLKISPLMAENWWF